MPGIAPLAAVGPVVQLGKYATQLHGRTLEDECSIAAQIEYMHGNVVRIAAEALMVLPREMRKEAAKEVARLIRYEYSGATNAAAERWLASFEGRIFSLWLASRHCGVTLPEMTQIVCENIDEQGMQWLESMEFGVDIASGTARHQTFAEIRRLAAAVGTGKGAAFPDYDKVFAMLQKEPFNKSKEDVLSMSMHQLNILMSAGDEGTADERDVEMRDFEKFKQGDKHLDKAYIESAWGKPYEVLACRLIGEPEGAKHGGVSEDRSRERNAGDHWWQGVGVSDSWLVSAAGGGTAVEGFEEAGVFGDADGAFQRELFEHSGA